MKRVWFSFPLKKIDEDISTVGLFTIKLPEISRLFLLPSKCHV